MLLVVYLFALTVALALAGSIARRQPATRATRAVARGVLRPRPLEVA
jgi:hypothetical protein